MATTSLSLGEHWEIYIKNEISSGRYSSASEVVRDALRAMEERKSKLEALRTHLAQGAKQASVGEFVDNFSMDALINDLGDTSRCETVPVVAGHSHSMVAGGLPEIS